MTPFSANPVLFIFIVIILVAVVAYYAYGAFDRLGVEAQAVEATVIGKQYNPPSTTYNTNIAGGRAWTQAQTVEETYALTLQVGDEQTVGLVSKQLFEILKAGDKVQAKIRRTRFSGKLEALEVAR